MIADDVGLLAEAIDDGCKAAIEAFKARYPLMSDKGIAVYGLAWIQGVEWAQQRTIQNLKAILGKPD